MDDVIIRAVLRLHVEVINVNFTINTLRRIAQSESQFPACF
jgi:hypothetical protein